MSIPKHAFILLALVLCMTFVRTGIAAPPADGSGDGDSPPTSALALATTRASALKALRTSPAMLSQPVAAQVDLAGAVAETLQILGQIVVDRASSKAYGVIQQELLKLLQCEPKNDDKLSKTPFPATCSAVRALRIEDVAMAPTIVGTALAEDFLAAVGLPAESGGAKLLGGVVAATMPNLIGKPSVLGGPTTQRVVDAILQFLATKVDDFENAQDGEKAVALGALVYTKCLAQTNQSHSLGNCNVVAVTAQLGEGLGAEIQGIASDLARRLISLSSSKLDTVKLRLAIDTAFSTSCLLANPKAPIALKCPTIESTTALTTTTDKLAFGAAFVDAAIAADGPRLIIVGAKLVTLLNDTELATKHKRALRLLGGLLDYASTYVQAKPDDKDAQAKAHDQRTRILESLTHDMSDRTGREGAFIFSLGGSLRVVGGARFGLPTKGTAFYGPLSLPLGISLDYVNDVGFHVEIDAVDLGHYLSLDNKLTVKTPEIGDAFAPSVTVGVSFGKTLPFVVGATAGWTPQFAYDADHPENHGTFNIGGTVGIHVPLIDLN